LVYIRILGNLLSRCDNHLILLLGFKKIFLTFKLTLVVEIEAIENLQFTKTWFYTVYLGTGEKNEYGKFAENMGRSENTLDKIHFGEIVKFIRKMGMFDGATKECFKEEGEGDRLLIRHIEVPNENDPNDYGLRLYCYWATEQVVILFNGARKTQKKAQHCPNCKEHFEMADRISKGLSAAIALKKITFDGVYIDIEEGFKLTI
jgi:hypothetical protein